MKALDNSVTTFPTAKFLELTFKNWRNMYARKLVKEESREDYK